MAANSLEFDFDRYRRQTDLEALGRVYDSLAPGMLAVALHVVRDEAEAEDLVQATFVAVLGDAWNWDQARPLRPWILGILRRRIAELHRRRGRELATGGQVDPGNAATDPGLTADRGLVDPAEIVEAEEILGRCRSAVEALPDPYRGVLVLRLQHGLQPTDIAHALGRPPATVRSQLSRGLALLRKALPNSIVLGAAFLVAPTRGLASIRTELLGHASILATKATALAGGFTMKKVLGAALIAVLLLGILALNAVLNSSHGVPERLLAVAASDGPRSASKPQEPKLNSESPKERTVLEIPGVRTGSMRLTVLWERDGFPAEGVALDIVEWARDHNKARSRHLIVGEEGVLDIQGLLPGKVTTYSDRGDSRTVLISAGHRSDETLVIRRGHDVAILVEDEFGAPIAEATVYYGSQWSQGHVVGTCDQRGRFLLREVGEAACIGVLANGFEPSLKRYIRFAELDQGEDVRFELVRGGCVLSGRVLDPDQQPVTGARIRILLDQPLSPDGNASLRPGPFDLVSDDTGCFRLEGLSRIGAFVGKAALCEVYVRAPDHPCESLSLDLGGLTEKQVEVLLRPQSKLYGRVSSPDGRGIPGARLLARPVDAVKWNAIRGTKTLRTDFEVCESRSRPDGRFELDELGSGPHYVQVSAPGYQSMACEVDLSREGRQERDFVLPAVPPDHRLLGRILDPEGRALEGLVITALGGDNGKPQGAARSDAEGRFGVYGHEGFPLVLRLTRTGTRGVLYELRVEDMPEAVLEIRVPESRLRVGSLIARALDQEGRPVEWAKLAVEGPGLPVRQSEQADPRGLVRVDGLRSGCYKAWLHYPGGPTLPLGSHQVGDGVDTDLGDVRCGPTGTLHVEIRPPELAGNRAVALELLDAEDRMVCRLRREGQGFISDRVLAGRYWIRPLWTGEYARRLWSVTLSPGRCERMIVEFEKGAQIQLQPRFGEADPPVIEEMVLVDLLDSEGRSLIRFRALGGGWQAARYWRFRLMPGQYRVVLRSGDQSWSAGFEVSAAWLDPRSDGPPREVELQFD